MKQETGQNIGLSERYFPYEEIRSALNWTEIILSSRPYAFIYREEALRIILELSSVYPIEGAFGIGYPFYLISNKLPDRFVIKEFVSFIGQTKDRFYSQTKLPNPGWICPHCQVDNNLPDLKTVCRECRRVIFKPRDLFKVIPDLDLTIIAPTTPETLRIIANFIEDAGMNLSDPNIGESVKLFIAGLKQGDPKKYVIPDLSIVSFQNLSISLDKINLGETDTSLPVLSYRGKNKWVKESKPPFLIDLVLSATPLGDPNLRGNAYLRNTMRSLMTNREIEEILNDLIPICLSNSCERVIRLLNDLETRRLVKEAIKYRLNTE